MRDGFRPGSGIIPNPDNNFIFVLLPLKLPKLMLCAKKTAFIPRERRWYGLVLL